MMQQSDPRKSNTPRYRQIERDIRKRIEAREAKPGDPIESERTLARRYGVSLMTARHALRELETQGFVDRRVGAGTFVAQPKIHFNKLISFTEQAASRSLVSRSQVISATLAAGLGEIASRLAAPCDTRFVKLERIRLADNEPLALETCYLPESDFSGILSQPLDRKSLFDILEDQYSVSICYADEEVDATPADTRTAKYLRLEPGQPVLRIRQLLYTASAKPIAYSLGFYRSDRHSVLVRRFR
jgi:GntR family transcriptional regulator